MSAILGLFWQTIVWTEVSEFPILSAIVSAILGLIWLIFICIEVSEFLILRATI